MRLMTHPNFSIRGAVLLAAATVLTFAGVVEDAQKLTKSGKYDEAIALLEKANTAKQPPIVKALAETHMAKADFFMSDPATPPRMKYPTALREYRKTLEYDKTSKKAQESIKTIEDIYKQMGRPVPN
jgi:tetratricopeptide (TPR) repeat protein